MPGCKQKNKTKTAVRDVRDDCQKVNMQIILPCENLHHEIRQRTKKNKRTLKDKYFCGAFVCRKNCCTYSFFCDGRALWAVR